MPASPRASGTATCPSSGTSTRAPNTWRIIHRDVDASARGRVLQRPPRRSPAAARTGLPVLVPHAPDEAGHLVVLHTRSPRTDIASGQYSAAQYRDAWRRLAPAGQRARNPISIDPGPDVLHAQPVAPGATGGTTTRPATVNVIGWDCYNGAKKGVYAGPSDIVRQGRRCPQHREAVGDRRGRQRQGGVRRRPPARQVAQEGRPVRRSPQRPVRDVLRHEDRTFDYRLRDTSSSGPGAGSSTAQLLN